MGQFILRRSIELVATMFIIITVSFFLIRLAPGSPFASEREVPEEVLEQMNARYGLDKPLTVQYFNYVKSLLQGDLGPSMKYPQRSVNEIIAIGFPVTLLVALVALSWALLIGSARRGSSARFAQNTGWDYAAMAGAMVGISLPAFVLGPLLVLAFSLTYQFLPAGGWGSWKHVVLPGITLGAIRAGYIARLTRGGMLEVVRADYIRTAKAKGLSESLVIWRHMIKGGLLPVVTYLGPAIAFMLVGSIVVEKIFNLPGIGPYFVDAAVNRDWFLVMGIIVLEAAFLLTMNLLVDIAYGLIDPRIRYE